MQNGGVAACAFTFDPADYVRAALTNMDGRPKLKFASCRSVPSYQHPSHVIDVKALPACCMVS